MLRYLLFFALAAFAAGAEPPTIPVGLDAYRQWDRWPYQRIGVRAYMRSTYDRRGGNEGADASHFLYQLADDCNVSLDVQGPGILCFTRYNHWHGSPWHYEVDGTDYLVQETSSANPLKPDPSSVFLPEKAFPELLTWTWAQTKGADLCWVPISFEHSFRMAYSRTHYGTGYYIYQQFVPGTKLSRGIRSWSENLPDKEVLELISRSGNDLVPQPDSPAGRRLHLEQRAGELLLGPGKPTPGGASSLSLLERDGVKGKQPSEVKPSPSVEVCTLRGSAMLRAVQFTIPREHALAFGQARLRITWDDLPNPSVDSPVALFFGAGTLYNRDGREYLVKAFPVNIRFDAQQVHLSCFFPMPFFHSARLELEPPEGEPVPVQWSMRYAPFDGSPSQVGYFHATYRDHPNPEPGRDMVLLDTRETEGGGDWSGSFVGTSFIFSDRAVLNTLEGDPRFFFDDSQTPQAQGTGTEEWGGGGDYWGGQNMTLPFAGHPTGARSAKEALSEEDRIESAYRFLLGDLMPFGKNALIRLEHGGLNDSSEHYRTVTYWYGLNRPSLVKTDTLKIGDIRSEQEHGYTSPEALPPYELNSRYGWGVDTLKGKEVYPSSTDSGRRTTGASEFNLLLKPDNFGVLLRRKLDYGYPNQRAEVFVAKVKNGKPGKFRPAGVWYLAGSSTCVYSNPKGELGATQHIVQTSNRRFRDDEFLMGRNLTGGCSEIRVRVKFTPVSIPLYPGVAIPELAWTEFRYDVYCFVIPGS